MSKEETKIKFQIEMFKTCCVVRKEISKGISVVNKVDFFPTITDVRTFNDVDEVWRFIESHYPKER